MVASFPLCHKKTSTCLELTFLELSFKAIIDVVICMRVPKTVNLETTLGSQGNDIDDDSNDSDDDEEGPLKE